MIRKGEIRVHKESGLRVWVTKVHPDGWVEVVYLDAPKRRGRSLPSNTAGYRDADLHEFFKRDPRATSEAQGGPR